MTSVAFRDVSARPSSERARELAERLERGASELANLARALNLGQWNLPIPHDGRTVGVVVHHVASMYPIEMSVSLKIAAGDAVTGLTWDTVNGINAEHASKFAGVTREETLDLLQRNSAEAAAAIRALSDEELDRTTLNSLYFDAPLTCQFFLEDHPVRHSYHHLGKIRAALKR